MSSTPPSLFARSGAEVLGTFLLVFFGCGSVHVSVLTGDLSGLGQVAMVWALAIAFALIFSICFVNAVNGEGLLRTSGTR